MNYYNILNFKKEPFSNSPEPEFLFQLPQYSECLQKLELAVRLRRGINVVIGDIGTGKTTLCRKLIQNFSVTSVDSTIIETHLLLDPAFSSAAEFLQAFALMLNADISGENIQSEWRLKERIKDCLFNKGVDEKKIIVLIIDEGQKIPEDCLEILREFLNYETNTFKLLQIIIFAQKEFQSLLEKKANLLDRINLFYHLKPLQFTQTKEMIDYRISVARNFEKGPSIFGWGGYLAVYLGTGGYPRRIVYLCHQVILKMIIRGKKKAGWFLVRKCAAENEKPLLKKLRWVLAGLLAAGVLAIAVSPFIFQEGNLYRPENNHGMKATSVILQDRKPANAAINSVNVDLESVVTGDTVEVNIENSAIPDVKVPDYIGEISMPRRRTVWWTLHNIYGTTDPNIMNEVLAVNPHLKNMDVVHVGTSLKLPAIPADVKPVEQGDAVIALESGQDLESMYNIFRNHPDEKKLPPLAFFAFWNKNKGFEFAVIIDKKFRDVVSAEKAVEKLPGIFASKAKIMSEWSEETIFFNRRAFRY